MSEVATRSESTPRGLSPMRLSVRLPWWVIGLVFSCVVLHIVSQVIHKAADHEAWRNRFIEAGLFLFSEQNRFAGESIILAIGIAAGLVFPRASQWSFVKTFRHISWKKREAILFAALTPVALRLALFPMVPVPAPKVADEFGYLLLANTFASGRIVNPPHPLWEHFETLYVLQEPVRASIYPFASGIVMAIPTALGADPWFGVLASVGLMCGAICWMLQGWLSPPWALLGALIAGVHVGIDTYWVNSYWGGAVAACGGALVLGALPRMCRTGGVRPALLMAAGLAILVQSRPFEGSLLFIAVAGALLLHYLRQGPAWRRSFISSAAPALVGSGILILAVSLFYNWRVTANPLLPPYLLHQQIYGTPQNLRFGEEVTGAPRAAVHEDIRKNFDWQRETFHSQVSWTGLMHRLGIKLKYLWSFFLGPALSLPLILFGLWDRKVRFLSTACLFVVLGAGILYPFFFPHYVAPVYGAMIGIAGRGFARIRIIRSRRGPVGQVWLRFVVASTVASAVAGTLGWTSLVSATSLETTPRVYIEEQLLQRGGTHLVLVRYGAGHDFHHSWIYNEPDIDSSPIVWARDLGKTGNNPILRYYAEREVWLAEPDDDPPLLTPYFEQDRPRVTAVLNAAGKSTYFKTGVAPGSLVAITGRNLARGMVSDTVAAGFAAAPPDALYITPALMRSARLPSPIELNEVRVEFDGKTVPLLAAFRSDDQETLIALAPADLPAGSVDLTIESGGHVRVVRLPVLPANPGIFQVRSADGRLSGAIIHSDGTPVTARKPARRGETVRMLVTGLGRDPVPRVVVGVNHRGADLRWTRRSQPGPGIDMVAFQIPMIAPSGPEVPLSMGVDCAGGRVYSNNSTIAIE